jgi:hypothetical protein
VEEIPRPPPDPPRFGSESSAMVIVITEGRNYTVKNNKKSLKNTKS